MRNLTWMTDRLFLFNGWLEWTSPSLKEAWSWRTTPSLFPTTVCTSSTARHHSASSASQLRKKMTRTCIWPTESGGHLPRRRPKRNTIFSAESNPCAKPNPRSRRILCVSTSPSISAPSFSFIKGTSCRRTSPVLPPSTGKVLPPFSVFLSCRNFENACWEGHSLTNVKKKTLVLC